MPVKADFVWRAFTAASVAAICGALPRGAQPPGQRESDFVSSEDGRGKRWKGSGAVSGAAGRSAEVLQAGGGVGVEVRTAGHVWLSHISYIYKDACGLAQAKV